MVTGLLQWLPLLVPVLSAASEDTRERPDHGPGHGGQTFPRLLLAEIRSEVRSVKSGGLGVDDVGFDRALPLCHLIHNM